MISNCCEAKISKVKTMNKTMPGLRHSKDMAIIRQLPLQSHAPWQHNGNNNDYNGNITKTRPTLGKYTATTRQDDFKTEQKHLALPAHTFSNTTLKAAIDIRGIHDEGSILTVVRHQVRERDSRRRQ